jgi:hypothetical protein
MLTVLIIVSGTLLVCSLIGLGLTLRRLVQAAERQKGQMRSSKPELHVEVIDAKIVVSLPESHYSVTYYKPATSPQLFAGRISDKDDPRVAITLSEFLAQAWKLANDKARELGWIV